jgi:hypothetical protein
VASYVHTRRTGPATRASESQRWARATSLALRKCGHEPLRRCSFALTPESSIDRDGILTDVRRLRTPRGPEPLAESDLGLRRRAVIPDPGIYQWKEEGRAANHPGALEGSDEKKTQSVHGFT